MPLIQSNLDCLSALKGIISAFRIFIHSGENILIQSVDQSIFGEFWASGGELFKYAMWECPWEVL